MGNIGPKIPESRGCSADVFCSSIVVGERERVFDNGLYKGAVWFYLAGKEI